MIEGLSAEYLLADNGYDINAIIAQTVAQGMVAVILLKKTVSFKDLMMKNATSSAIESKPLFCI